MQTPCIQKYQTMGKGIPSSILFVVVSIPTILFMLSACAASPYRWTALTSDKFPAKVSQIITVHGDLLDHRHRTGYGEWDVMKNTTEPPMASYACTRGTACQIVLTPLQCTNARLERMECSISLDPAYQVCRLLVSEKRQILPIRCPIDVVFVRGKLGPAIATTHASTHTPMAQF